MENIFEPWTSIRDIVTKFPKASDIFKEYRIDFCCGGNRPLVEAIQEKNLSEREILEKLESLYQHTKALSQQEMNWEEASYSELIDHIVYKHHAYLMDELPPLGQFVTKILRVHGAQHHELSEVYRLFNHLKMELEQHTMKEDEEVFPLIKEYESHSSPLMLIRLQEKMETLEQEHDVAGNILKELRRVTKDYLLPEGACTSYRLTYQRLEDLESDLFQHIHLENNLLFPRLQKESV